MQIEQGEIRSVRSAARNLYALIEELQRGDLGKAVLLNQQNELVAVVTAFPSSGRQPDFSVFYEWCLKNAPRVVEMCPYKFGGAVPDE